MSAPSAAMLRAHEIAQWRFLRWRVEQELIGGPNDGADGPHVLDDETARRLRREIMERIRRD